MRSRWFDVDTVDIVLNLLRPPNRLAIEVSMSTGLRIGDVLQLHTKPLACGDGHLRITEQKTGKRKRVYIGADLRRRLLAQAGTLFVFQGKDELHHRTRQAIYADLRRATRALRLDRHLTPHSARKMYAVALYRRTGDIAQVQKALNHTSPTVTIIYALADQLDQIRRGELHG